MPVDEDVALSRDALVSSQVENDENYRTANWNHTSMDEGDIDKNDNNIKSTKAINSASGEPEVNVTVDFDRLCSYSLVRHVEQQVDSFLTTNVEGQKRLTAMTEKKTSEKTAADKKFTEASGIIDTDVENMPFQDYDLALSDLGMELFLKVVRTAVSTAAAAKQVKSKVIRKSSARKRSLYKSYTPAMLPHIRHPRNKKSQLLKFKRNAQTANRLMEGYRKSFNHMGEKFSNADDKSAFDTSLHYSALNNDEGFWKHIEPVENFKELLSDDRLIMADRIMDSETGSKAFADSRENLTNESVDEKDAKDLQPDFDLRIHHQTLSLSSIANRALERQRATLSSGSQRRNMHQAKYRHDERAFVLAKDLSGGEHFATAPDRNDESHLTRMTSGLDEREMIDGENRLDWKEIEKNVITAIYGWNERLSEQWTDNARCEYYSKNLDDVGGFPSLTCSNKFSHVQQPETINRTDSNVSDFEHFCKLGPRGTSYVFQNFTIDDIKLKSSQTYNPHPKSSLCVSVLSDGEKLDNAELMCDSFESDLKIC